ncbi:MAG: nicotinate (nicotinamide) nucleotide adenylyltransferase [Candidatus Izemoplasmataceae bacterium]
MKVVFGGAFNPVTKAHMDVYHYLKERLDFSEFIFLPVSSAYTKSELASNYHRLNMLEIVTKDFDDIEVSKLEIDDSDFLGTYQSLIRLYDKKEDDLAFVVGADNLFKMHKWINIEGILSEFKVVVLGRNGLDIETLIHEREVLDKHRNSFIVFDQFKRNISSTTFRETLNKDDVEEEVYQYIFDNKLYGVK